ncbi:AT-rich interactive domain-containing protein 4A [Chanos chanos]|uniref:AT-rich interactive domain-containing protein 4A n=1 Tax=Chanos chanos TaxID=29144 RepID=A0A6J2V0F3_CHACN|nr:AT-rich interactive domain-containing protein 4A [Chanos chanos]
MKAADEPAYLTVGTDVSAKYRGAFCEAKIKTVKRMVKVKVVLKGDSSSQVVQDDQVKGPLRVGSTVEVKSPEGGLIEAVISKLTDASWYTVVFDDGDEKTLRRTSLCLKGERHFAESETLDQLPLTNPEHFGTPVIGKKTNRGRRSSQAVADDEKESSSSEDEDEDRRRLSDDLLGKVACIQNGTDRTSWYLALVISPSCNDDLTVKKDQCLVRSFADSKFHTVARKEIHELNIDSVSKSEYSSKKGFDGALHFLKTKMVPDSWKMDMSEILESSSSDDEDGEGKESEEEEKETGREEPDDEPDPEERDHFLQQLYKFMEDRGTPINKPPVLGYKDLNLFKLFRLVHKHGGCDNIESGSVWKQIYMDLGIPVLNSAASYNVKTAYRKYLYGFEEYCRSANIEFRTVHHDEPRPVTQVEAKPVKTEESEEKQQDATPPEKAESGPSNDKPSADGDESDAESEKGQKDVCSPRGRRRCTVTPVKAETKEPVKQEKIKEEKKKEEVQGTGETSVEEKPEVEAPTKRRSRRQEESDKDSEEEDQEEEEDEEEDNGRSRLREREERDNEDEDGGDEQSVTGTKVKVKYGRGKTQKIYEANIKNTETDDGEVLYLVHYYGWNVRYDEWVKADRIIWPVDKGGTKKKQKKKVKNKDDGEKEKDEEKQAKVAAKRGRPPLKSTPPNAPTRSVSKTPNSEGRSGSKNNTRPSDPSVLPNGEVTPRRQRRRTPGIYDSDRGSNDSGNSSEESDGEDSSEKKPEWAERTDPATARKLEEEEEKAERGRAEEAQAKAECPSSPQEKPKTQETQETEKPEEETAVSSESDKSPKSKARKGRLKEPGSETPTHLPATTNHLEGEPSSCTSPCPVKKPQEPPVQCGPTDRPPNKSDSDTDSAEEIGPEERVVAKRKATEQRTPEKKVRLDRKEEAKAPSQPKLPSPEKRPDAERRIDAAQKVEERLVVSSPVPKETEVKSEMPALTREVQVRVEPLPGICPVPEDPTPGTDEELMPQIGPEALVCHEVDLDDLDEKEKPSGDEALTTREEKIQAPLPSSTHLPHNQAIVGTPRVFSPASAPSPDESHSTKSESDVTIEVDSVAESQEGLGENESNHGFDASASSSNSSISLQERDNKDRGQKRLLDCNSGSSAKKQKRNQKRTSAASKTEKNGAGHSSDSEDLSAMDTSTKLSPVKHSAPPKAQKLPRPPGVVSPNSKDVEKDKHKDKQSFPSPRTYKWTFQLTELDNMTSAERISFLQEKLQEIRKYYMSLKSEVASIDRRRKRLKKKEREVSHTTASTSSGSSDTGMSPSSASPTQNTVAVECR